MTSCLRQMRRDAVHRDAASRETDRAPPRPATLILGLTVALFLVLLLVRALAGLVAA
ncbi:MAG: hypothetical protein J0I42_14425 [Bosea sp.]|uniref:hypothetical protein n=1 Tax=Bosea sp. (in: a-proteobacteria) TaxID=1871050 RepID=UPI001ACEDF5A|nr:hypothetical protein [Bosea sp. (in: a-proteobacteria)]MBN9453142.1 hypothetical protein [Bosea sp. (in: a-proteobacteria)]